MVRIIFVKDIMGVPLSFVSWLVLGLLCAVIVV